jgi:integration host factor subunit alpha
MSKENGTITRADLVDAIFQLELPSRDPQGGERLSREGCAALVEAVIKRVSDAVVSGDTVKLSSFGAFSVREKAARMGRNPKTKQDAVISPRRVLSFRASHVMKEALNPVKKKKAAGGKPKARRKTG